MAQRAGVPPTPSPAAERIRFARRSVGMTQAQLAQEASRSPGAVGQWEIGMSIPDETVLRRLARTFRARGFRQPWWWYAGLSADPHRPGPDGQITRRKRPTTERDADNRCFRRNAPDLRIHAGSARAA